MFQRSARFGETIYRSHEAAGTLPIPAAVLLTTEGYVLESRCYEHPVEPEPEGE